MFEMFPLLFNNLMGNNQGNNIRNDIFNENNYNGNMYSGSTDNGNYKYGTFTNGNDIINVFSGSFAGTFNNIFNEVFTTLINNEELINGIVDTVMNSDVVNSLLDEEEEEEELKLEFRDYGDRYLIEGKIEGVDKKDIDVDYDNEHISIKVKRDALKVNSITIAMIQDKDYIEKSFYVPKVDPKRIQAVFNADVLRIYLKKLPEIEEGTTVIDVEDYTNSSRS
ncbi:MAG: Hsp20 family protein [Clostridium sp.]|uniref:Hsp20 family protein n=1 Tax=Clostridium sp. TaxID=1506 RepID=UPI002A763E9B|nr:Hsp20 family protein [Clostridium sp.]MCI6693264.1 Hsp20 family protein [Clostridium sp.]MDY2630812.1 Hsp20 family protein [Clostridium sp.]MDY4253703.1 Hsp20 family protein [Clostridium sp.]